MEGDPSEGPRRSCSAHISGFIGPVAASGNDSPVQHNHTAAALLIG